MTHDLQGKTALVTGASRGLGAAIACKLAACGARTAVNYFGSPQKACQVHDQIRQAGGTAAMFQAEVRDESAVAEMIAQVTKQFSPIDILILDATGPQPFLKLDDLTWRHCLV
jgi:NAD(P)-dependent dehydrogenase (short-subunit alcohol dehydrogenase family)